MKIGEVKELVKDVLKTSKMLYINDMLEKTKEGWNLTYYVYGITYEANFILYTKFSFLLDKNKEDLKENKIVILYDLNCNYYVSDFNSKEELNKYLINLFKSGYDKGDIRDISNFLIDGTDEFNKELKRNKKNSFISNLEFKYDEKIYVCNNKIFEFILTDNTNKENKIYIQKHNKNWIVSDKSFKSEMTQLKDIYSVIIEKLY